MSKIVTLLDRAVVWVAGADAKAFLQSLVTNNMDRLDKGGAIMAGLLSPQGKILYEFFIVAAKDGYLLDTARGGSGELLDRLNMFKLRSDVVVEDCSEDYIVTSLVGLASSSPPDLPPGALGFVDPRHDAMGWRVLVPVDQMGAFSIAFEAGTDEDYLAHRLLNTMPEGGHDYAFGDVFPHEAGYDVLKAVDFDKGCYVGQEVVSRMQHRSTVRKRFLVVESAATLPHPGTEIRAGASMLGILGSSIQNTGLALCRLDRVVKARAREEPVLVEGVEITLSLPPWASYSYPQSDAPEEG